MCACAQFIYLPASLSASGFQGAGRQAEPKVFIIMCANPSSVCYQLSIFVLALLYIIDGAGMWVFINNC
jgi:hypothetical protein